MREVIATGKTVEEATENACKEIGLSRDEVSVEILEMPVSKLFKRIPAKIKVTAQNEEDVFDIKGILEDVNKPEEKAVEPKQVKQEVSAPAPAAAGKILPEEPEEEIDLAANARAKEAVDYLKSIIEAMGVTDAGIQVLKQGNATLMRVSGEEIDQKMEISGDTIQALSYLIDRSVNAGVDKREEEYLRIRLDIAGYRNRRETELIALAERTGREVAETGRSRTLAPMNPYERLIVHTTISKMEGIMSESIGADVERRVVIKSLAENATDGEDWRPPRKNNRNNNSNNNRRGGGGNRNNYNRSRGSDNRGGNGYNSRSGKRESSVPQREYADKKRDPDAAPIVPEHREAIRDGDDLPLYGKIEL